MNRAILLLFFTVNVISVLGKEKAVYLVQGAELIDLIRGTIPKSKNVTLTKVDNLENTPDGLYFEPEDELSGPYLQFVKNNTKPVADDTKPDVTTTASHKGKRFATRI